jgi:hypothetical protein
MDGDTKRLLTGVWLLAVGVIAYALAGELSHYAFERFGFPSDHPGDSPPWYFIRQDYIDGIVMGGIGLLCILVGVLALRRFRVFAEMLIWQTLLWFGGSVWQAVIILMRSDHVMDPALASTTWQSFDAYIADPLYWRGKMVLYLLVGIVVLATLTSPSAWRGRLPRVGKPAYEHRDR